MRNFAFKLERYAARTGQSIDWLRGNIYFYIPFLLALHTFAIPCVLSMFVLDIFSLSLCIYAGIIIIAGIVTMILLIRVSAAAYHFIIAFSMLNAIRCIIVVCVLLYSIVVSMLYPPVNEADAHMPITFVAILFLIGIAIELAEGFVHIGNICYISKRKKLFEK